MKSKKITISDDVRCSALKIPNVRFWGKFKCAIHLFQCHFEGNNLEKLYFFFYFIFKNKTQDKKYCYSFYKLIRTPEIKSYELINEIFNDQMYDIRIDHHVKTVVDIGANIGDSVMYFGDQFPKAKIYAFEPNSLIQQALFENVIHNNLVKRVKLYKAAVVSSNSSQKVVLQFPRDNSGIGTLLTEHTTNIEYEKTTVLGLSFRKLILKIKSVDLLKIDIEGYEKELIPDLVQLSNIINHIIIELHIRDKDRSFALLELLSKGYILSFRHWGYFSGDYKSYLYNNSNNWQTVILYGKSRLIK